MAPGMLFRTQARQKRRSDPVTPRGLVNLGNTCYLNAVVQALAHCTSFASRLVGDAGTLEGGDNDAKVSRAFAHICSALSDRGRHSAVRPAELICDGGAPSAPASAARTTPATLPLPPPAREAPSSSGP